MMAVLRWVAAVILSPLAIRELQESLDSLHGKIDTIHERLKEVETELYQRWRD